MGKRTRPKKPSVRLEVTFLQRKADSISDVNPKIDKASGLVKLWKQVPDIFSDINEDTSIDELHDHFEDLFDDPLQCQLIGWRLQLVHLHLQINNQGIGVYLRQESKG